MAKNAPADARDAGSIPGLGRFHMAGEQLNPMCRSS